jgi:hypothetical protein
MPVDMVLIISYSRICEPMRRFEKIVNKKSKYNDVNNIVENRKQNYCLEMFRLW